MKTPATILSPSAKYSEKLRDTRWKEFSRSMRTRKGNCCEVCGRKDVQTHIHHWFYDGREPWEYSQDEVGLLCAECHAEAHEFLLKFRKHVWPVMRRGSSTAMLAGLLVGLQGKTLLERQEFCYAILGLASQPEKWARLSEYGAKFMLENKEQAK